MINRRRDFLGWLGASALLAVTATPLDAQEVPGAPEATTSDMPVSDRWDMSWVDRIHGDARAVFDSPAVSEGDALWRAVRWRKDYEEVYGTKPNGVTAVLVIRHAAIELVMDDEYWARFKVGRKLKLKDQATEKWAVVNPIRASPAGTPGKDAEFKLESFIRSGGIVLACHVALLGRVVEEYRRADALTRDQAEARAREHLVRGVILQPSGIFAALRAQQAGCSYIMAS